MTAQEQTNDATLARVAEGFRADDASRYEAAISSRCVEARCCANRVFAHLRAARAGETPEETQLRAGRDVAALLDSPFVDVWAQAGLAEILSALHERLLTSTPP